MFSALMKTVTLLVIQVDALVVEAIIQEQNIISATKVLTFINKQNLTPEAIPGLIF